MAQSRLPGDKVGKNQKIRQMQNFTPEQMELQRMGEERVGPNSNTARMAAGDESIFNQMEAPALRQFSQLQGNTASRFSSLGGQGSLSSRGSSGFQNEMNQAGSNFAQDLQSRRQELTRQATMDLHNMSQGLLSNRPYERWVDEQKPDQGWDWGGTAGAVGGGIAGFFAGGPPGAVAGAGTGYNMFKRQGGGGGGGINSKGAGMPGYGGGQSGGFGDWNNLWSGGDKYANYGGSGPHYNFPGA